MSAGGVQAGSLVDTVEDAIAYHPQIIRDQARSIAADNSVEEAYSDFLPDLDLDVSTGGEITSSPTTRGAGRGTVDEVRSEGRLSLSQMVFDFFETSNRVASARSELRSTNADLQATSEAVARLAIQRHLETLQSQQLVDLAQRSVADHVAILDLIRGRVEGGQAPQADLDQALSRVSLVRSNLVNIAGLQRQAISQYIETVGVEPEDLELPSEPDFLAATDLDAALATAMDRNPIAHATASLWDARRADIEVARGAYFPRFDVEASGGVGDNLDGAKGLRSDARVQLRMVWNLFGGLGDLARVRRATFQANAASRTDAEARRAIRESVRVSFRQLQTANDRLPILREDVESSQLVFQAYREQYDVGQRTLLDLLDARDEQFNAEANLVNGEFEVLQSSYDLLFFTGIILEQFGIVIFEPELNYEERVEVPSDTVEVQSEVATAESIEVINPSLAFDEVTWGEEVGLPGVNEFGSWLGEEVQMTRTLPLGPGDSDEAPSVAAADDSPDSVDPRREFAGIEVVNVPSMAALPEQEVVILPAVAYGEFDKLAPVGYRDSDLSELPASQNAEEGEVVFSDQADALADEPENLAELPATRPVEVGSLQGR